ncbi:MAG: CDC48 family AAA ATPase [Candidatus Aenigmatarchaeota archaeon]
MVNDNKDDENKNGKADNAIALKVGELLDRGDFGRGIIRLGGKFMKALGVNEGDTVEVEGKRKTIAMIVRGYPSDAGLNVIRMDGLVRHNAGTSISENVKVRQIEIKEAKSVTIAPVRKDIMIRVDGNSLKSILYMRPMQKGDVISLNPVVNDKRGRGGAFSGNFFGMDLNDMFGNMFPQFTPFGEERFVVVDTSPKGSVRITDVTEVIALEKAQELPEERGIPEVLYEDLGGLHNEIKLVREMIELPMRHPELFQKLNIDPPKGVLLQGPPGTGKTLLAKAVANESGANFIVINGPEIMSKWYGGSEENLRKVFEEAEKSAPSIIFIDEIDAIAPKREETHGEVERRVVSQILTLMDGLKSRGKVIVIGATNRPNALDPALRRPGRFDREIEIGVPDKNGRKEILQIHSRGMPFDRSVELTRIADVTHGYVGADLEALCKEAAMHSLRRVLPDIGALKDEGPIPDAILKKLIITSEDFEHAQKMVEPSAMREVLIEVPKVKWEDIGGLEKVKALLKESIEWPLKHSDAFKRLGIKAPKGILLYGPPGTGKTLLAKAVANESEANFILINAGSLLSMYVGESERHVREIFKRAKQVAPTIIFFDEIDALATRRRGASNDGGVSERVVSQILTEISGLEDLKDVVVIGATNRPDLVDSAIMRPGRLDRQILIPTPDEISRREIFKVHTKNMPLSKDINLEEMAKLTSGYSGADIEAVCREAALNAMRLNMAADKVNASDFSKALQAIKPSVTDDMNDFYEKVVNAKKEAKMEESMLYTG